MQPRPPFQDQPQDMDPEPGQLPAPLEHEPADQEDPPEEPAARITHKQIKLQPREQQRLYSHIWENFIAARADHDGRIARFRRYWRMWRGLNQTRGDRNAGQDLQVPLIKWTVFGQWAKFMAALMGDDAEIVARASAPTAKNDSRKVGTYMTWRIFEYMQATIPIATWVFRAILFGRGFGECIYTQEYYFERDEASGDDKEVLAYDGPKLKALWPSQLILPAQDVDSIDDFEWKIRRDRITPQDLLDGEEKGKYFGIQDRWVAISSGAQQRQERDFWWDDEKIDADEAEGVDKVNTLGRRDSVEIWWWYGKWRLPKGGRDVMPDNLKYRAVKQSELLVAVLPKLNMVISVEDLRDIYPRTRKRHPFLDLATVKDGSYWAPGIGELLEDLQNELSINHALFRKAGMLSTGPVIFYKPNGEFDPETFKYDAGTAVPTMDPTSVKVVTFNANLEYCQIMNQALKAIAELVTGVNDQSLGRASDRPNAPQTAAGQAMLLQEGNTRAGLDMMMLREDISKFAALVWLLDREYGDKKVFFRVTEEDAVGYDVNNGFGTMTAEEREHPFSFDIRFATSVWAREAKKQMLMQLYGLSMQNPIVQQDPKALWTLLNRVWQAFGEDGFQDVIPEPPQPERPKMPKEEWALMLKGEVVHVSPIDDDDQHIIDHRRRLEDEINEPDERQDLQLQHLAKAHIIEHERQKRQKMVLQQLAQKAMQMMQQAQQQNGGQPPAIDASGQPAAPGMPAGGFGAPPVNAAPEQPALAAPPPQPTATAV